MTPKRSSSNMETDQFNMVTFEQLNNRDYSIWSIKMEALLDTKELFDEVILDEEPTRKKLDAEIMIQKGTIEKLIFTFCYVYL